MKIHLCKNNAALRNDSTSSPLKTLADGLSW